MSYIYFTIPAGNDLPFYTFKTVLNGISYTFVFKYVTRSQRWNLDIQDAAGNLILGGIPLLIQRSLTGQYPTLALPAGLMYAVDNTGKSTQPTQFSFGATHQLVYGAPA